MIVIEVDPRYPRGKLNESDQGELEMRIGVVDATVVVCFGKPVHWLGLDAADARSLAALLLKHAAELEGAT